ncbi:FAS-associated factor 2-B [Histomonas meleagridis]|uniref:FAS-associated factor 2-B n=1 Tax=Histomonas meleagridis TaxID=135588 RepID=UPI00355A3BB7|nr:FAS-associated factor 2-B [Histomonas meleagridis]KAH0804808.1 FAS-associated factor 2-B [Histomonas meleagridis]
MPFGNQEFQYQLPFIFPFDSHPGPVKDAIEDAKNLNRSLFLFIYCIDNPNTYKVSKILQSDAIANEIHSNFIFLPLDVSFPEGWHSACDLKFTEIPMIAIVRPEGTTLNESHVFAEFKGIISEDDLLSSIRIENHHRSPDVEIIEQQNEEFNEAIRRDTEATREEVEEEQRVQNQQEEEKREKEKIEKEFDELPEIEEGMDVATIRFQFPDNVSRIHKFPRDQTVNLLFVFARKFMFPKKFVLVTGFPQYKIDENGKKLSDVCREKNFIVHVEEDE